MYWLLCFFANVCFQFSYSKGTAKKFLQLVKKARQNWALKLNDENEHSFVWSGLDLPLQFHCITGVNHSIDSSKDANSSFTFTSHFWWKADTNNPYTFHCGRINLDARSKWNSPYQMFGRHSTEAHGKSPVFRTVRYWWGCWSEQTFKWTVP